MIPFGPLCFWRQRRRHAHAEALACLAPAAVRRHPQAAWVLYRLDLYRSVLQLPVRFSHWRAVFARTVALAACGQPQAATDEAQHLRRPQQRLALAGSTLAAWAPELALQQLAGLPNAPAALQVALLLHCGEQQQARQALRAVKAPASATDWPLPLLSTWIEPPEPMRHLAHVNAAFAAYGLPPVALRNPAQPPNATNLNAAPGVRAIDGPLVTVLMTAYRSADRISAAIASVLAQSYRRLELIVIDDASDDDTAEQVRDWCRRDERVRLRVLPCNVGPYLAKHLGLQQARGEFITCHDADDWSHPLKIARQIQPLLADRRLIATTSLWIRLDDNGRPALHRPYPLARLNPSSLLFRRQPVLAQTGAWDLVRTGADSELIARLKLVFGRQAVRRLALPLAIGAYHPASLINTPEPNPHHTGMSPLRLDYWEAWNAWHVEQLRARRVPRLPSESRQRPFPVPTTLQISPETIDRVIAC
jgi:hypothetical protein